MTLGDKIKGIQGKRPIDEFAILIGVRLDAMYRYEANTQTPSLSKMMKIIFESLKI